MSKAPLYRPGQVNGYDRFGTSVLEECEFPQEIGDFPEKSRLTAPMSWGGVRITQKYSPGLDRTVRGKTLHRNVQRSEVGVFKANRLCVSLNSRLESNKKKKKGKTLDALVPNRTRHWTLS